MNTHTQQHRSILQSIAHRAMLERGLLPDFSSQALAELEQLQHSAAKVPNGSIGIDSNTIRDKRNLIRQTDSRLQGSGRRRPD